MEVVEDFESRLHKAVSFMVERDKEVQEWIESTEQRTVERRVRQNWDCSQIEDRDEEEVMEWHEEDELKEQWRRLRRWKRD